jgi:hypothetical protein
MILEGIAEVIALFSCPFAFKCEANQVFPLHLALQSESLGFYQTTMFFVQIV